MKKQSILKNYWHLAPFLLPYITKRLSNKDTNSLTIPFFNIIP